MCSKLEGLEPQLIIFFSHETMHKDRVKDFTKYHTGLKIYMMQYQNEFYFGNGSRMIILKLSFNFKVIISLNYTEDQYESLYYNKDFLETFNSLYYVSSSILLHLCRVIAEYQTTHYLERRVKHDLLVQIYCYIVGSLMLDDKVYPQKTFNF